MFLIPLSFLACTGATENDASTPTDAATHGEPEWGYEGETGPEHWGELDEEWAACGEGMAQSPIGLVVADMVTGADLPPVLAWSTTTLNAYNSGYYIRYDVDPGSTLTWNGAVYDLLQFHFHGLSEHTLEGEHTDVEIHFVHARQDDPTQLAVVAVLASAGPDGEDGVFGEDGALLFRDALALSVAHEPTALGSSADLGTALGFVNLERDGAMQYSGSLTTPPCTEGVEFFVYNTTVSLQAEDVEAFHAVFDYNYRPVQPINGRTVTLLQGTPPT